MKDDFVARLWAARKIGSLETALMDMGGSSPGTEALRSNSKTAELVEEIMRLSRDFGIMSSAASFLPMTAVPAHGGGIMPPWGAGGTWRGR